MRRVSIAEDGSITLRCNGIISQGPSRKTISADSSTATVVR